MFISLYKVALPKWSCTTIHRYPIYSTRYSVMCKVYTGYQGTSEIEHGFCVCMADNPLAKARGLPLRTGAQTISHLHLKRKEFAFYAPNFEKVEGAYWFGPVHPSVRLSVRNTFWQLRNSRTAFARILKFYMWHVHEK